MSCRDGICIGSGTVSVLCYLIGAGLAWVFSRVLYIQSGLALAAAIVISLPIIAAVIGFALASYCSSDDKAFGTGGACGTVCGLGSAFFDLIGVGLLIAAMVQAPSDMSDDAGPIVCGVLAIIFVTISGITNLIAIITCACGEKIQESG